VTGDALSTVTANIDDRWARVIGDRDDRDRGMRSRMVKASGADRSATIVGDDHPVMATGGVRPTMETDVAGRPTAMPAAATVDDDRPVMATGGVLSAKARGDDRSVMVVGADRSTARSCRQWV
jgi:hypothetical protein